eukprot:scaffold3060_cov121-Isochrysis_galbana.AAC.9
MRWPRGSAEALTLDSAALAAHARTRPVHDSEVCACYVSVSGPFRDCPTRPAKAAFSGGMQPYCANGHVVAHIVPPDRKNKMQAVRVFKFPSRATRGLDAERALWGMPDIGRAAADGFEDRWSGGFSVRQWLVLLCAARVCNAKGGPARLRRA